MRPAGNLETFEKKERKNGKDNQEEKAGERTSGVCQNIRQSRQ
jgi:hypothetical protein